MVKGIINNTETPILLKIRLDGKQKKIVNQIILTKYLEPQCKDPSPLIDDLAKYLENFYHYCFEIKNNSMLKGQINFKY